MFLKDPSAPSAELNMSIPPALDLAMPKHSLLPPPPMPLFHNPYQQFSRLNLLSSPIVSGPTLPSSPPVPPFLLTSATPDAMCEAAARLLFLNVKWAKNVPALTSLSLSDRMLLLEESWRDLFVIGTAQFLYPLDLKLLCDARNPRIETKSVEDFETVLAEFAQLRPDSNEYACLRAIALFKTNFGSSSGGGSPTYSGTEYRRLQDLPAVAGLQDHSQAVLNEVIYIITLIFLFNTHYLSIP